LLLIYTHKITPRLTYIFKHIFVRILQIPIQFTTEVAAFVAHNGPKITYTKTPLGKEFFIRNHSLLFEQGIGDLNIKIRQWDDTACFFSLGEKSAIPFDIFAASFYLVSRYEEYQPFVSDEKERFAATQSFAYQNKFLEKPVVDIWAYKFLEKLQEKYPNYQFANRSYRQISTIVISEAYLYKNKGIIRGVAGFFKDLLRFKFKSIVRRFTVVLNLKEDPYDTYNHILKLHKNNKTKTVFFFLFSEYTTFDTNVSYANRKYRLLIKSLLDYTAFGQIFSHYTMKNTKKLVKEKKRFEDLVNRPVTKSRQHNNRLELPKTYQILVENHIEEDYSMGYDTHCGFRASTCTPFYFYDLDYEIQTPLKVIPYVVVDKTLLIQNKLTAKEASLKIKTLQHEVQKVQGVFVSVFHNETLSDLHYDKAWHKLYKDTIKN